MQEEHIHKILVKFMKIQIYTAQHKSTGRPHIEEGKTNLQNVYI